MCGIAGLVSRKTSDAALLNAAQRMGKSLGHRGPDDAGDWIDSQGHIAFAHRRLAIQDLSRAGAQPMLSNGGRFCIVLNGEIYNFRELVGELRSLGHSFRGHSDTEVLLAAIEQWGFCLLYTSPSPRDA